MDALDLLKTDHQKVRDLFKRFDGLSGAQKRRALEDIRTELDLQTYMEEAVFYPFFKEYDDFRELLHQAQLERQNVKNLLKELSEPILPVEQSGPRVDELRQSVERHAQKQEADFFPMVRKTIRRPEREQLGRHMQAAKDERAVAA